MEHGPTRNKILDSFKVLNAQFEQSVLRGRADLQSGLPLEDLVVGGIAEFSKASPESLAAMVICRVLKEASKPVRAARKKTNVPAKRDRVSREVPDGQSAA